MANVNVRVPDDVKNRADELFSELGMNTSIAINVFLRKAIECDGLPFPVRKETPNSTTRQAIDDSYDESNLSPRYSSTTKLMEALNA